MGRTRLGRYGRTWADEPGLGECVRRWWPFAVGALAATGLLLGAYLWVPRKSGASVAAGAVPRDSARPDAGAASARPMASYTTRFQPGQPRVRNIELAARMLDGRVVRPGATFSFNKVVGPRTRRLGYVPAPAIMGSRLVKDVGGGICQVSTTLFNAVFRAGLDIRKARAHTMWMPEYPEGREAAVAYPNLDFTWKNDTDAPVRIQVGYTGDSLTVSLWGHRRYEVRSRTSKRYGFSPYEAGSGHGRRCVPMAGRKGFKIDVWRTLLSAGRQVRQEKFHTEYRAQPEVTCV
ncbi:VanW family protein [Actinomadura sp. NPDC048394]|uniref:VanW family protein n=1 Tax=Actinomadura sp. NPDC048394 TaxID=3158223 RepID=UPI0033F46E56